MEWIAELSETYYNVIINSLLASGKVKKNK